MMKIMCVLMQDTYKPGTVDGGRSGAGIVESDMGTMGVVFRFDGG